ncbi:HNH endonuclease signature motif containing protein [Corynebacterium lubricantis]|uniref:HNH endonuclease signature motif containing protein n=1 Tax=Corynebacterium lubricantis TaxID=541095 RepID=UPI00039DA180|nr:HNH endonuclease signature motif containing protein [Corynebacterium lubricantis]
MSYTEFLESQSDEDIIHEVQRTSFQARRSKAELLISIAQFHKRKLAESNGAKSTSAWLVRVYGFSRQSAHEYISVGTALLDFNVAAKSLHSGEISYSALRMILKYMTYENEFSLVDLARELTIEELRLALAGLDPAEEPKPTADKLTYHVDEDGRVVGSFNLNPIDGANFLSAIKIGELSFKEDFGGLQGDDFADDEAVDKAHDEAEHPDPSRFGMTPRANKLLGLRGLLNIARSQPIQCRRAPGAQINVTMTTDGHAFLPFQPGAPSSVLRGVIENGFFKLDLVDENGIVINRGRTQRIATDHQADSVLEQSRRQCGMPGCNNCNYMEIHHLHEWAEGGATDMDNLLALCSSCHTMVTMGQIRIEKENGDIHYYFPDGSWYTSTKRQPPRLRREASAPKKQDKLPSFLLPGDSFDDVDVEFPGDPA